MSDRFWVSPLTASFDSTNWSTVSGGSPGASVPNSSDIAYFNGQGPGDCLVDGTTSVFGLNLGSGYPGTVYGSCDVLNILTLSGGYLRDGTISTHGDVDCSSGFGSFSTDHNASIVFTGTNKQSLFSNGGIFPHVEINKPTSNQVKAFGNYPIYVSGDFLISDGTFHTNGHDIRTFGAAVAPIPFYDVDFDWEIVPDTTEVPFEYMAPSNTASSTLFRSTDGSNWEGYNVVSEGQFIYDMTATVDGTYVMACSDGIYTTTDFNNIDLRFTATDFGGFNSIYWFKMLEADGTYVVVGSQGGIAISTNTVDWELIKTSMYSGNSGFGYNLEDVKYANGIYLISGQFGQRARSYDASNWTIFTNPTDLFYGIGVHNDSTFVLTAKTVGLLVPRQRVYLTTDGSSLSMVRDTTVGDDLFTAISHDGTCVIAGGPSGQILTTTDFASWTDTSYGYNTIQYWTGNHVDGKFYLSGFTNSSHPYPYRGLISTSSDGISWEHFLNSGSTTSRVIKVPPLLNTPSNPGALTALAITDTKISLSWTNIASNAYGYKVDYSIDGINFSTLMNGWRDTTSYDHTNLLGNTTYWYRLQATNLRYGSSYSSVVSATTYVSPLIANFSWNRDGTNDLLIHFINDSTGLNDATVKQWDFGDVSPIDTSSINPSHMFPDYTTSYLVNYSLWSDMSSDSTSTYVSTSGPFIGFTKTDYVDSTDIITSAVHLTRKNSRGIFNAVSELSYINNVSPADTEWSYIQTTPINDPTLLPYTDWENAVDAVPPDMVNCYIYMHIISENRYFEMHFLSWTQGALGGGFSYNRREIV
jgi:hypothetical protein